MLCEVRVVNTTLMCYISKTPAEMGFVSGFRQRLQEHSGGCYCDASKVPFVFHYFMVYKYYVGTQVRKCTIHCLMCLIVLWLYFDI